jgi:nitrate/nitrite-specific signal transduction histidine kinase
MRRHYFINKKLQVKYILLTIAFLLVYTLLFVCLLLAPYIYSLTVNIPLEEQAQAARMLLNLHNSIWPILGVVILIMSFMTIYITHRIAGPVYRLKSILDEVAGGNLDIHLNLREKDDLKELAGKMNRLIDDLRTVVGTLDDGDAALTACLKEIEQKIETKEIDSAIGNKLIERLATYQSAASLTLEKYRHKLG